MILDYTDYRFAYRRVSVSAGPSPYRTARVTAYAVYGGVYEGNAFCFRTRSFGLVRGDPCLARLPGVVVRCASTRARSEVLREGRPRPLVSCGYGVYVGTRLYLF